MINHKTSRKEKSGDDIIIPIFIKLGILAVLLIYYLIHKEPLGLWDKVLGFWVLGWGIVILPVWIAELKDKTKNYEIKIQELETEVKALSNPLSLAALEEWHLTQELQGCLIIAKDTGGTYLGTIDFTSSHSDSIFNEHSIYSSDFSPKSIWNELGTFGSEFSSYSPFNESTATPPVLIKNKRIIGHLSKNQSVPNAVTVEQLLSLYKRLNKLP